MSSHGEAVSLRPHPSQRMSFSGVSQSIGRDYRLAMGRTEPKVSGTAASHLMTNQAELIKTMAHPQHLRVQTFGGWLQSIKQLSRRPR